MIAALILLFYLASSVQPTVLFIPKGVTRHIHKTITHNQLIGADVTKPLFLSNKVFNNSSTLMLSFTLSPSNLIEINLKSKFVFKSAPSLWLVSPSLKPNGRGLRWKKCPIKKSYDYRSKKASKTKWKFFYLKDSKCTSRQIGSVVYAVLSVEKPCFSARAARRIVKMLTKQPKFVRKSIRASRKPQVLLTFFTSNGNHISIGTDLPTGFSDSDATVSPNNAIEFFMNSFSSSFRVRRSVTQHEKDLLMSNVPDLCRRRSFKVKAADIGVDNYFIYPTSFDIGTCSGICMFPLTSEVHPKTHSVIQMIHHTAEPHRVPAPSCVPTSFKPIRILVRNPGNKLAVEIYRDLVVKSCGCR